MVPLGLCLVTDASPFLANAGGNVMITTGYFRADLMMFEGLYAMATNALMRTPHNCWNERYNSKL
jgi:hypothetical protein